MSIFSNIYTVIPVKDFHKVQSNGLSVNSMSGSDKDHIVFTDDYSEIMNLREQYGSDIAVLSFNTSKVKEINKSYSLHKLDESHYYTVERIDPIYLTYENKSNMFVGLTKKSGLNESKLSKYKLYEKYGMTENLDILFEKIIGTMYVTYPVNTLTYHYPVEITKIDGGRRYNFELKSFPCPTWINPDSSVTFDIYHYQDRESYIEDIRNNPERTSGIYSTIDFENSDDTVLGHVQINLIEYPGAELYFNNIQVNEFNKLIPYMRHEFNHLHKNIKAFEKPGDEFNESYVRLVNIANMSQVPYIKTFAECLYMYCIMDERNANVEQYFEEHIKNPGSEWERTELNRIKSYIDTYVPKSWELNEIYLRLSDIVNNMFNISKYEMFSKTDKQTMFFNKLKKFCLYNIELIGKKFDRIDKHY